MEKVFILEGLDCPHCAAEIEQEVGKLPGVSTSSVNLMKQTLTVQVSREAEGGLQRQVEAVVHSHEPHVQVKQHGEGKLTKVFLLAGLDCPHCAGEIEADVGKLPGVSGSSVNLMKQTLTVLVSQEAAPGLQRQVEALVHAHEPEVGVSEYTPGEKQEKEKRPFLRLAVGAVLFALGLGLGAVQQMAGLAVLVAAYIVLGWDVAAKAVRNILQGRVFDENFLMTLSTVGAFCIGEYPEAVAVMLFYQIGELFQEMAVDRSRRSIAELMDIRPDSACVLRHGEELMVSPELVAVGETIVVRPGERIPLDGTVVAGTSALDTKALTGESLPRTVQPGDTVLSGCINQSGVLTVCTTRSCGESTAAKIIELVENASSRKAPAENFITTFARWYTPAVVILAALLAVIPPLALGLDWAEWIHRGFVFLVISCPCALVISIPLTFFGGIGAASRHGVLVKGSNYLEALNSVGTVVFDKTGTLTKGVFRVADILAAPGFEKEQVLELAARAEQFSAHPIAGSILAAYPMEVSREGMEACEEIPGRGVSVRFHDGWILAGSKALMEENGIAFSVCELSGTKVYVAKDGCFAGTVLIADEVKPDSAAAVAGLRELGVKQVVMLTGDEERIASAVADELKLDGCYAQLLPQQKVELLEKLDREKKRGTKLVFVGDGINDAPVLARADIGIAMGGVGSDAAIEAADVVLMTDEPTKLLEAISVAKATKRIVIQNIVIALGIKGVFLLLGALGLAGMWVAVFGDVGVAMIAVLNAMRILKK